MKTDPKKTELLTVRCTTEEMKRIKRNALKKTKGDVSKLVRDAAMKED